jgi:hypothetical protein
MPRKQKTEARQAREFGVVLAVMGLLAAAGFYFIGHHVTRAYVALGVSGMSLTLTFLVFPVWLAFFRRWMIFAEFMGMVMSTVILTIFFYLFFTPIVLVTRLFGKKMLDLSWNDERDTYWIEKSETPATLERYERQF